MIAIVEMLREQLAWERTEKERLRQKLEAAHEEIGALKWKLQQREKAA